MKAPRRLFFPWLSVSLLGLATEAAPVFATETNQLRPWLEYRTIMWVGDSAAKRPDKLPLFFRRLREMGINTAMVYGDASPQPLLDHHFPYYVENLVNRGLCLKFNSQVRDWDKFVTDWTKAGRPQSAFIRDYCLDDPQWQAWARREVQSVGRKNATHAPLAYNIRDELSTTISANPFDYDFNPIALAQFREWLKTQYRPAPGRPSIPALSPSGGEGARRAGERDTASDQAALTALNAEWETHFNSWDEVQPFSTDQIKNRMASGDALPRGQPDWQAVQALRFDPAAARPSPTRWNFAPWCDFRTYMDLSLARVLDGLRQAAHEVDPRTPVGIEGTQMPSAWGGYDLWRLARALDWVEPYDIGNAREIFGSFMPGRPILTTVFERDSDHARRRLWHLLLEGDRGCIVWWSEDCIDWSSDDLALTPKARALAPVLQEMNAPLAQLFLRAEREYDPIALHYSQPSIQVDWLLESTVDGSTWHRRFSSFEGDHNRLARVRDSWLKAFQDLGYSPKFLSAEQLAAGELRKAGARVLVLPGSAALSAAESEQVRAFLFAAPTNAARFVFCDGTPGLFDEHGRLKTRSRLQDLFPPATSAERSYAGSRGTKAASRTGDISDYAARRLLPNPDFAWARWIGEQVAAVRPEIQVPLEACVRVHRFKRGHARLVAFERNIDYQMSEELKQAGGNERLERPVEVVATLAHPAHVYDLRSQKYLGKTERIRFLLNPWSPALFALLPEAEPADGLVDSLLRP